MSAPWMVAAIALLAPLAIALFALVRGPVGKRLAAMQAASVIGVIELAMLSFAFDQPAAIDLALTLALLSLPAALLYAVFHERWI